MKRNTGEIDLKQYHQQLVKELFEAAKQNNWSLVRDKALDIQLVEYRMRAK